MAEGPPQPPKGSGAPRAGGEEGEPAAPAPAPGFGRLVTRPMIFPFLEAAVTKSVNSRVSLKQETWVNRLLLTGAHSPWNFDFEEPEGPIPVFYYRALGGCPTWRNSSFSPI